MLLLLYRVEKWRFSVAPGEIPFSDILSFRRPVDFQDRRGCICDQYFNKNETFPLSLNNKASQTQYWS